MGNEYRITVYATDVEKASSNQRAFNVRPDNRLAALLNASAEDEVERAVADSAVQAVDPYAGKNNKRTFTVTP